MPWLRHGCQTFDLLLYWFGPALDDLAMDFYGIAEYEVEEVYIGKTQVTFHPDTAKRLCWIPIKELIH